MTKDLLRSACQPVFNLKSKFKARDFTALKYAFLSLATVFVMPSVFSPCLADSGGSDALSKIEQRLFFKEYSGDSETERLDRIEKQIFGESYTGSATERLARISGALPPIQQPPPQKAPTESAPLNQRNTTDDTADTQEDLREKQRLAALAARDEEVAKLLEEGVSAWRARKGPLAIDKFQQVVRLDPQNAQAYFSLGVALEAKGAVNEAKQAYEKAAELEPDNKEYAQSAKVLEKHAGAHAKTAQKDAEAKRLAEEAQAAYKAHEYLSALDLFKQLDQKEPKQALTKYNIGSIYMVIKKPVSALDYYQQALKLNPNEPKYRTAVEQLKANIDRDDQERQKADALWDTKRPQTGGGNAPPSNGYPQQGGYLPQQPGGYSAPATAKSNPELPGKQPKAPKSKDHQKSPADDPLGFYGMTAKSSGDGVKITEVVAGSRTAQVGLKPGDIVKAMDGTIVTNVDQMKQKMLAKPMGSRFQLSVQRDQKLGNILY
jgi:tetratricopeptide (TPR) repeat protein